MKTFAQILGWAGIITSCAGALWGCWQVGGPLGLALAGAATFGLGRLIYAIFDHKSAQSAEP